MSHAAWHAKLRDDYVFLICCNIRQIIAAWDAWDGCTEISVNGRVVEERAVVWALQDLGHDVVI